MRTQVAIIGAGPSGLLLGQLLHKAGIDNVILERQSADYVLGPHPRRHPGAGHGRPAATKPASASGVRPRRHRAPRIELVFARRAAPDRRARPHRRQGRHRLRPDRADARPDGGARRPPGLPTVYEAADVSLHGFDGDQPVRALREGRRQRTSSQCDFIAGCDGFHGVSRATREGQGHRVREGLSVRLAGRAGRRAAGVAARHRVRQQRARLLAVLHAQPDAQPLLRAVPAGRQGGGLERRSASGTSCAAGSTRNWPSSIVTGPTHREEHRAAAQLRRRADALRPPVPGRRRRAHRAAHRRQGPEPGGHAT